MTCTKCTRLIEHGDYYVYYLPETRNNDLVGRVGVINALKGVEMVATYHQDCAPEPGQRTS